MIVRSWPRHGHPSVMSRHRFSAAERTYRRSTRKSEQNCQLGRGLQVVGNNSLNAPLNPSAFGGHSSASAENSYGIDPNYCCRGAVVRRRWILGSAARPLVKISMIDFPNHSRSYDVTRHAVRFWGHDSAIEASFFVDEEALARIQPGVRPDESGFLNAFDANRDKICAAAARVYVRGSRGSYDLGASDF